MSVDQDAAVVRNRARYVDSINRLSPEMAAALLSRYQEGLSRLASGTANVESIEDLCRVLIALGDFDRLRELLDLVSEVVYPLERRRVLEQLVYAKGQSSDKARIDGVDQRSNESRRNGFQSCSEQDLPDSDERIKAIESKESSMADVLRMGGVINAFMCKDYAMAQTLAESLDSDGREKALLNAATLIAKGDAEKAREVLASFYSNRDDVEMLLLKASIEVMGDQLGEAQRVVDLILKSDPWNAYAWMLRLKIFSRQGQESDREEALQLLRNKKEGLKVLQQIIRLGM